MKQLQQFVTYGLWRWNVYTISPAQESAPLNPRGRPMCPGCDGFSLTGRTLHLIQVTESEFLVHPSAKRVRLFSRLYESVERFRCFRVGWILAKTGIPSLTSAGPTSRVARHDNANNCTTRTASVSVRCTASGRR
jgi:hypothetical protein